MRKSSTEIISKMRIITISREFGSGGRELGRRLADRLGFDYYDREIIRAIAQAKGLNEEYVEKSLENPSWKQIPLTFRRSFASSAVLQTDQINLLLEQKKVIEDIAKNDRDCVIVGRNADVILAGEAPFSIFVCADMDTKIRRCMERAAKGEELSQKAIEQNIRRIDKNRARTREMVTGSKWGQGSTYHMMVNSSDWEIRELAAAVADFAGHWFKRKKNTTVY